MNEYKLENVFIKAHIFSFVYCKKNGWNAISIQIELKCVENVSFSLDAPNLYNKCFFSSIYAVNRKFKLMPKKPSYHQIIIAMCVPRTTTKEIGCTTFSTLKNASLKLSCKCQFMLVICMHSLRKCNRTKCVACKTHSNQIYHISATRKRAPKYKFCTSLKSIKLC